MNLPKDIVRLVALFMPWALKRRLFVHVLKYEIAPSAHIGFSWVAPRHLVMLSGARISSGVTAVHLDKITMGENSRIGRGCWITGFPGSSSSHFSHIAGRVSELFLGRESAITKNHHIDCTATIHIGEFSTVAGYQSQLLTHSIDIHECRQDAKPIRIGDYCFVGTNVVVLGGASLGDCSVLGAKSLLRGQFHETHVLVAGVPAKVVNTISPDAKYFKRPSGFVR